MSGRFVQGQVSGVLQRGLVEIGGGEDAAYDGQVLVLAGVARASERDLRVVLGLPTRVEHRRCLQRLDAASRKCRLLDSTDGKGNGTVGVQSDDATVMTTF